MDDTTSIPRKGKGKEKGRPKKTNNAQRSESSSNVSITSKDVREQVTLSVPSVKSSPTIAQLSEGVQSVRISPPTRRELPPRAARPLFGNHLLGVATVHTAATNSQEPVSRIPPQGPRSSNSHANPMSDNKEKKKTTPTKPRSTRNSPTRDEKCLPSAASGGVPDPSTDYITTSHGPIQRLLIPQNLLVVIDLNGTLLFRPSRHNPTKFITRPDAQVFLQRCLERYTVVIWSSAKPQNVRGMCQSLGQQHVQKAVAIWGRDRFGLTAQDYNLRVQCYKRLTKLWEDPTISKSHPKYHLGCRWDQTNTVLIDDSLEKARSEPHNLIQIPEFMGDAQEQGEILRSVDEYLQELSMTLNVSGFIRERPFMSHPPTQAVVA
ncbi:Protein-serine-threonine phosphatase/4-nitrophenylphosphatase, partial [Scytalidium lignicola]